MLYTVYLEQSGSFLLLRTAYVDAVDDQYLVTGNQLTVNVRHAAFYLTSHTRRTSRDHAVTCEVGSEVDI